jgi:MFS family permease
VANVALPDIGRDLDASQTQLNLVAVGFSLGLAASVLYLGALGDRYGRKMMLVLGVVLSIPAGLLAAWAPSVQVLAVARIFGGLAAGMVLTLPIAAVAPVMAVLLIPSHVNETTDPVDNLGGVLSVVLVSAVVLGINFAPVPGKGAVAVGLAVVALAAAAGFVIRQRRARYPLYDLEVAGRRVFWVAALAGIIVFGALMGAMFIGQQFLQNVHEYSSVEAGAAILPAAVFMVLVAPTSARLVEQRGSRFTLLLGSAAVALGFVTMPAVGREQPLLARRSGLRLRRHRRRHRRDARLALADRLHAGDPCGHGVGDRRPAA